MGDRKEKFVHCPPERKTKEVLAQTSITLCIDTRCPIFFFGEGASEHRLDLEVYGHLPTNEIVTKKSTRHQRITLK